MESSAIPAAGEINVSDAPKISPVEFLRQIIENIQSQISSIDAEFLQACKTDNPEVCS
jgi:hypothetical protein